jgi:phage gp37-like protein
MPGARKLVKIQRWAMFLSRSLRAQAAKVITDQFLRDNNIKPSLPSGGWQP